MEKEFVWTDELVIKFAHFTNVESPVMQGRYADLDQFKASHQPKDINHDWEIVEYGGLWDSKTGNEIRKVKRLSDQVVFSVGDEVCSVYNDEPCVIQSIEMQGQPCLQSYDRLIPIANAKKSKPIEKERPPLGVIPEWRHKELRFEEVDDAITRYVGDRKEVPQEWFDERLELHSWLTEWNQKKSQLEFAQKLSIDDIMNLADKPGYEYLKYIKPELIEIVKNKSK